jgi:hypothetical protein
MNKEDFKSKVSGSSDMKWATPWGVLLLCIVGAVILYNTPRMYSVLWQAVVLSLFWFSKKNYIWLSIVFFVWSVPGGLFHTYAPQRLFIVSTPFGELFFYIVFIIMGYLKTWGRKTSLMYQLQAMLIFSYTVIIVLLFGASLPTVIRFIVLWSLIMLIPRLLLTEGDYINLFRIFFVFNIFLLIANVFEISAGFPLVRSLVSGGFSPTSELVDDNYYLYRIGDVADLIRPVWGIQIAYISMIGSLFCITRATRKVGLLNRYATLLLSVLNIFFSATRGWIFASMVVLLIYTFYALPKLFRATIGYLPVIMLLTLTLVNIPLVRAQFDKVSDRLELSYSILGGELSDESTGGRFSAGREVFNKFKESPIIGLGYGEEARKVANVHTGNQTMLMRYGVIGFALYLLFWLGFVIKLIVRDQRLHFANMYKNTLSLVALSFIGLFLIHSTSGIILDVVSQVGMVPMAALILAFGNFLFFDSLRQNAELTKSDLQEEIL